jgi:hypothetical protein
MRLIFSVLLLMLMTIVGCEDKAEPAYRDCVAADARGDILAAETACIMAIHIDDHSKSAEAATVKLRAMQPAIEKAKAKAKAEAAAQAAPPAKPRPVATRYDDIDDICSADGLGRKGYAFSGGTVGDVVETFGCVHMTESYFCCWPSRVQ